MLFTLQLIEDPDYYNKYLEKYFNSNPDEVINEFKRKYVVEDHFETRINAFTVFKITDKLRVNDCLYIFLKNNIITHFEYESFYNLRFKSTIFKRIYQQFRAFLLKSNKLICDINLKCLSRSEIKNILNLNNIEFKEIHDPNSYPDIYNLYIHPNLQFEFIVGDRTFNRIVLDNPKYFEYGPKDNLFKLINNVE